MEDSIFGFVMMAFVLAIYFLPSIIAYKRGKKNTAAIVIVNFFFGWTFIGWVLALAWAVMQD